MVDMMKYKRGIYKTFIRIKRTWDEYKRNKIGLAGLILLSFFIAVAVIGPYITPYKPNQLYIGTPLAPPNEKFLLGTDELGRDILTLVIYGTQISLIVGLVAAFISIIIGSILGLLGGYYGGILSDILMRITDMFIMMPWLPLMIVFAALFGSSIWNIMIIIGITTWPTTARTVMSQVLSLRERLFVEAVKAVGANDRYIIFKTILPNTMPIIFTNGILSVAYAILYEAGLSFLGLGDPTHVSWGMILYYANSCGAIVSGAWWYILPPGICITLLVLAFTLISHGLDEVLNPRLRAR